MTFRQKNILFSKLRCPEELGGNKRIWKGYLTPIEILTLVKMGATVDKFYLYKIEDAKERKKKGDMSCQWFYFQISNKALSELQNLKTEREENSPKRNK